MPGKLGQKSRDVSMHKPYDSDSQRKTLLSRTLRPADKWGQSGGGQSGNEQYRRPERHPGASIVSIVLWKQRLDRLGFSIGRRDRAGQGTGEEHYPENIIAALYLVCIHGVPIFEAEADAVCAKRACSMGAAKVRCATAYRMGRKSVPVSIDAWNIDTRNIDAWNTA